MGLCTLPMASAQNKPNRFPPRGNLSSLLILILDFSSVSVFSFPHPLSYLLSSHQTYPSSYYLLISTMCFFLLSKHNTTLPFLTFTFNLSFPVPSRRSECHRRRELPVARRESTTLLHSPLTRAS